MLLLHAGNNNCPICRQSGKLYSDVYYNMKLISKFPVFTDFMKSNALKTQQLSSYQKIILMNDIYNYYQYYDIYTNIIERLNPFLEPKKKKKFLLFWKSGKTKI